MSASYLVGKMAPLTRGVSNALVGVFCLALLILPLQPLWLRVLEGGGLSPFGIFIATNWVGAIIVVITIFSLLRFLIYRIDKIIVADYLLFGLLVVALLSFFWKEGSASDYVIGLRYSAIALVGYFIGRVNNLWQEKLDKALLVAFWGISAVALLQLFIWVIGASNIHSVLRLDPTFYAGGWPRLFGAMAGPNQLATFLTISGLWLFWRKKISPKVMALCLALVVLTFSRSAILGLLAGLAIPHITMQLQRSKRLHYGLITVGAALLIGGLVTFIEPINNSFFTDRNTSERLETLNQTLGQFQQSTWSQTILGHGAGSSGPAAFVIGRGTIPENWFLQIGYEYGLVGLCLLLSSWLVMIKYAYSKKQPWLAAIIVAMAINSLFLHPLSDNFPVAIWFYLLLGVGVSDNLQG